MGFAADDRLPFLNSGSGMVWLRTPIHFVKLVLWFPLILLLMLLYPMLLVFGSLMIMELETSDFIKLEYFFRKLSFSRYLLYFAGCSFKFCLHLCFLIRSVSFFASAIDSRYFLHISALISPLYFPPLDPNFE